MTIKSLGLIALLGAPFLCIGTQIDVAFPTSPYTWWTGVWGLLYITGWMASMEALRRLEVTGTTGYGKGLMWTIVGMLLVADLSNIWQLVAPGVKSPLFFVLDMCWPLSNLFMLVIGVAVLRAKRLTGWERWVPLAVGCWLPLAIAMGRNSFGLHVGTGYSAIAWMLLAIVVLRQSAQPAPATRSIGQPSLVA